MDGERRTTAVEALRCGGIVGGGLVVTAATRRGTRGSCVASLALTGSFGVAIYGARRMVANTFVEARHREGHQQILIDAQLGAAPPPGGPNLGCNPLKGRPAPTRDRKIVSAAVLTGERTLGSRCAPRRRATDQRDNWQR